MHEAHDNEVASTPWTKSTFSGVSGCVEVARYGDQIAVRDSKNPTQPFLRFTGHEWSAFLAGAKAGEFDSYVTSTAG
jgi:Domain of unknown function (DUF397)